MGTDQKTHKQQNFETELGQKVTVQRDQTASELAARSNKVLRNLGEGLNPIAQHLDYKGSMAIHIYQSQMLGQIFFISQTDTLQDVPEETASAAFQTLKSDAMAAFGRNRQTKRSGF